MRHLTYLAVLAACLLGTAPLEIVLHTRVYARWRRLLATLLPVLVVFLAWDAYAVAQRHWRYDPAQTVGLVLPGGLPVEEVLFFVVVPICAVLTLEAVRAVKGWPVGDEPRPVARPTPLAGRAAGLPVLATVAATEPVVSYTLLAALGVAVAVALDLVVLRTRLLTRRAFWVSYAIIVGFQLLTNGILTGRRVVVYDPAAIVGLRIAYAPVEDLAFGFALVVWTLAWWVWWGRRPDGPRRAA